MSFAVNSMFMLRAVIHLESIYNFLLQQPDSGKRLTVDYRSGSNVIVSWMLWNEEDSRQAYWLLRAAANSLERISSGCASMASETILICSRKS